MNQMLPQLNSRSFLSSSNKDLLQNYVLDFLCALNSLRSVKIAQDLVQAGSHDVKSAHNGALAEFLALWCMFGWL